MSACEDEYHRRILRSLAFVDADGVGQAQGILRRPAKVDLPSFKIQAQDRAARIHRQDDPDVAILEVVAELVHGVDDPVANPQISGICIVGSGWIKLRAQVFVEFPDPAGIAWPPFFSCHPGPSLSAPNASRAQGPSLALGRITPNVFFPFVMPMGIQLLYFLGRFSLEAHPAPSHSLRLPP